MSGIKRKESPVKSVARIADITREDVLDLLDYDHAAGAFKWRIRAAQNIPAGSVAGGLSGGGYMKIRVHGHKCATHRLVWLVVTGEWPAKDIDHINGDRSDNRFCNLREASRAENSQNRKVARTSKSGLVGVRAAYGGKWIARISAGRVRHFLGTYETKEDAAKAYANAKRRFHPFQPVLRESAQRQGALR